MVHAASGFRGTRVGVNEGTGPRNESDHSAGVNVPRMRVSFWCDQGHQTQLVFLKLPDEQIPALWDCRHCGRPASRDGAGPDPAEQTEDGYKSHLEYVKERRSGQDAEAVLAGALERLRAGKILPDQLSRDP